VIVKLRTRCTARHDDESGTKDDNGITNLVSHRLHLRPCGKPARSRVVDLRAGVASTKIPDIRTSDDERAPVVETNRGVLMASDAHFTGLLEPPGRRVEYFS
jgi:hypothetical protein